MTELRDFLRTIRDQAAAGDPATAGTVRVLADWLEEHGDARALWVAGQEVRHHVDGGGDGWQVWPGPDVYHRYSSFLLEADAIRELARRVMAAMTRECGCGGLIVGDIVAAVPPYHLACGSGIYPFAIVVCVNPLVLCSEYGDMLWSATLYEGCVRKTGTATAAMLRIAKTRFRRDYPGVADTDCQRCHGDGWLLTEAEACGCDGGRFHHLNGETVQCPDCAGRGWRVKQPLARVSDAKVR